MSALDDVLSRRFWLGVWCGLAVAFGAVLLAQDTPHPLVMLLCALFIWRNATEEDP